MDNPELCQKIYLRVYKGLQNEEARATFHRNHITSLLEKITTCIANKEYDKADAWLATVDFLNKKGIKIDSLAIRLRLGKARCSSVEQVQEYFKEALFLLVNENRVEDAHKLMEEWELSEEERKRFIIPLRMPKLTVLSSGIEAGSHALVTLDGKVLEPQMKEGAANSNAEIDGYKIANPAWKQEKYGLWLFLIDHLTHEVTHSRVYNTHGSSVDDRELFAKLQSVKDDQIVVLTSCGDCMLKLEKDTMALIETFGSKYAKSLQMCQSFAFIGGKGNQVKIVEMRRDNNANNVSFIQVG